MTFQPIKTKKIYEEIMEQIRRMMTRGDLQPGDRLPSERELAETLSVSRTSVREALTALGALGILDVRPGEGTFIRRRNDSETFEPLTVLLAVERNPEFQLMEVRRILETEAAALAAKRATPADLEKIEKALQVMKDADSVKGAVEADLRFHYTIAEATKNSVLLRIMNTVADLMHNNFRQDREALYVKLTEQVLGEHEAIVKAIKDKNPDEAWARMLEHINNIESGINESLPL